MATSDELILSESVYDFGETTVQDIEVTEELLTTLLDYDAIKISDTVYIKYISNEQKLQFYNVNGYTLSEVELALNEKTKYVVIGGVIFYDFGTVDPTTVTMTSAIYTSIQKSNAIKYNTNVYVKSSGDPLTFSRTYVSSGQTLVQTYVVTTTGITLNTGSSGITSYTALTDKPQINSVELSGNKSLSDLSIQHELTAGTGISIVDNVISSTQASAVWGNITGTLSNQTDLLAALNGKEDYDATILKEADVVNDVTTATTNKPLAANQGKVLNDKLNENVVLDVATNKFAYSGDTVTYTDTYKNLKDGTSSSRAENISLANSTTAGLMSHSDYTQIRNNTSRIQALEGQTVRLLYTIKTNPTASEIAEFVAESGYTTELERVAVVVSKTKHIWHYYTDQTPNWVDDGVDTVNTFTNSTAGIIKGSSTTGQVYAENDGTGSVNGWSNLVTSVSNKQDQLTPGTNIQINNNVISATDTTYSAGTGIDITNNVISATGAAAVWGNITGTLSNQTDLQTALNAKSSVSVSATGTATDTVSYITVDGTEKKIGGSTYTAGNGIDITDNAISVEDDLTIDNYFANEEIEFTDSTGDFGTYANARIDARIDTKTNALSDVKYTAQSLTDAQKLQARTNIGASNYAPVAYIHESGD